MGPLTSPRSDLGAAEPILQPPFEQCGGLLWRADLPVAFAEPSDSNERPVTSRLRLRENGALLGPGHTYHDEIQREGGGRYSHHRGFLWFSTSDGSDPNTNGRYYTVSVGPPTLKLLGFGSCNVNRALQNAHARGLGYRLWNDPALTYTPSETLQVIEFLLGSVEIPADLQAAALPIEPGASNTLPNVFRDADIVYLEFHSLIDIICDPWVISRGKLITGILPAFLSLGAAEGKLWRRWYSYGLNRQNESVRQECAEQLIALLPRTSLDRSLMRHVFETARGRLDSSAAHTMDRIRAALGAKAVCVLAVNNAYMPDGRPISWPRDFAKDLEPLSRGLGFGLLRVSELVAERGIAFSIKPEVPLQHFTAEFLSVLVDEMLALGRQFMEPVRAS